MDFAIGKVPQYHIEERLQHLSVFQELRQEVAHQYKRVLVGISFPLHGPLKVEGNIGVECPLSPTLSMDENEHWLACECAHGIKLTKYVVKILFYDDNVVLLCQMDDGLQ